MKSALSVVYSEPVCTHAGEVDDKLTDMGGSVATVSATLQLSPAMTIEPLEASLTLTRAPLATVKLTTPLPSTTSLLASALAISGATNRKPKSMY